MQSWYQVEICCGLKFIWTEILRKLNIRAFKLKVLLDVNFVTIFFKYQEFNWSVQVIWVEVNNKLLYAPVGSYPRNHCLPPPVKRKYALFRPSLVPILGRSDLIIRLESPARIEIFVRMEIFFIFYFYVIQKKSLTSFSIMQRN